MRARAILGGAAIVAAVVLWHRPVADRGTANSSLSRCAAIDSGDFCDALVGLSKVAQNPIFTGARTKRLPPPETPGAIDPAVTQANIDDTVCRPGYARSARPAYPITGPLKRRMMTTQHPDEAMADYELDHLIPISIGGAPLDRRDLWLQPRRGELNAEDKNVLAYVLWRLVCTHKVPLQTARRDISRDWTRAYQVYATPENIAKYHFRHEERERE